MTFETEYQLQEFRDVESEYFDERGNQFKQQIAVSDSLAPRMLKLINQLESEIVALEKFSNSSLIAFVK